MKNDRKKNNRAEQRKTKLEQRRKMMKKMMVLSVVLLAAAGLGIFYMFFASGNDNDQNIVQTQLQPRIPISEIGSDTKFYSYNDDGVEIRYFAIRGPDGEIHVALDACDVCYDAKKGYRQIDDVMQCINCGKVFPINSIGTDNVQGGCWPSYLPMKIDSNDVIIEISDLQEKRFMFE